MRRRVVPCLLLSDGGLYKTERFKKRVYVGDPINAVRLFNDKEADEIMLLNIGTTNGIDQGLEVLSEVAAECFVPLCYGGGVRTLSDFDRVFALGVEKVSIATSSVRDPRLIEDAAARFGSQSVVVTIDFRSKNRRARVFVDGGNTRVGVDPVRHARECQDRGAGEIVLQSIDRDGTQTGYDLEVLAEVTRSVDVPVVALGGAAGVADLASAFRNGAAAAAAGSMFVFHGPRRAVLISYVSEDDRLELD